MPRLLRAALPVCALLIFPLAAQEAAAQASGCSQTLDGGCAAVAPTVSACTTPVIPTQFDGSGNVTGGNYCIDNGQKVNMPSCSNAAGTPIQYCTNGESEGSGGGGTPEMPEMMLIVLALMAGGAIYMIRRRSMA